MSRAIIVARGLGKSYRLGEAKGPGYGSLRESLANFAAAPARLAGLRSRKQRDPFWALRDVSFEIAPGEVVGIIGRNGAGKSTLLKILSRITAPTEGEVRLRGKLAALLEVGAGFHPELTGRENVFLNGSIMGMSQSEVRARFDEIVAFAEVERFLDTAVKHYSTGMRVRLAFAVAAHLQPEILVVDEVLAVGDASFQRKSLGKMQGIASSGRTVLFVSHNLAAITRLCSRGLLLSQGRVVADGPVSQVVSAYVSGEAGETPVAIDFEKRGKVPASEDVRLLAARVSSEGLEDAKVDIRKEVRIEIDFEVLQGRYALNPNVHVFNEESLCVFISSDASQVEHQRPRKPGRYRATMEIPGNFLAEGIFSLDVAISTMDPVIVHVHERGLLSFHVQDAAEGTARGNYAGPYPGAVRPILRWRTEPL